MGEGRAVSRGCRPPGHLYSPHSNWFMLSVVRGTELVTQGLLDQSLKVFRAGERGLHTAPLLVASLGFLRSQQENKLR